MAQFLRHGLGISRWKGEEPIRTFYTIDGISSVEAYILIYNSLEELSPGLYHYRFHDHSLYKRCDYPQKTVQHLIEKFGDQSFLVGLSQQPWKHTLSADKRGWRNTQLEHGHLVGNLSLSAATKGWAMTWLQDQPQILTDLLLGLTGQEGRANRMGCLALAC